MWWFSKRDGTSSRLFARIFDVDLLAWLVTLFWLRFENWT
ncbi:hypothetical protein J2S88_003485 [Agrobacterium tumefaciens]|uniref:Transposase n=1 Tax=Agrobacterium tumefaciens TaxID=358 RepID=A0AAW8M0N3_AGRTU|nr:hypothetical protein L902_00195 [Agrobacterium radiobacter DSM 30147]MBB4409373.1 hypothetical protein [Agrobacterium radiobacter]MBP2536406.1 hypothetical protein [Agrobacterium tumefaciens]MCP2137994.1 hypothetical protein [Rhizobium sp. SLBN-94]MBB4454118.1 hypothetical protein [Agrobacterium radiobacter]